jgi:excisionase family DNA binding protein
MTDQMLKADEVSRILRVSEKTVHRLVREQKLPAVTIGKRHRFHPQQLEEHLRGGRNEPKHTR